MADAPLSPPAPEAGPVPASPPSAPPAPAAEKGISYWQLVWLQFRKNWLAYGSLLVIGTLFLVAAWAPLLVNGKPLYWRINGQTTYPLLQFLVAPTSGMSIEYVFNYLLFATLTIPLALLVRRLAGLSLSVRKTVLAGLVLAILPFIGTPSEWFSQTKGFSPFKRWRQDEQNYIDMARRLDPARGDRAIFPLIAADARTPTPKILEGPSGTHLMGTDKDGQDVFARMVHGTRISISVGFVAVSIEVLIGIFFGALAGFYRGWIDIAISRFIELIICFPSFFLILTIVAFIDAEKRSTFHIMVIIGLTGWTGIARLVRGEFLKLAEQDFVQSARALGCPSSRLMFRHILPNALAPVLVAAAFGVAGAILTESSLSYLGFGPPLQPTWGEMISQGKEHVDTAWWLIVFPGFAIFMTVTVYNLAGDGLRDAMDPKMRK